MEVAIFIGIQATGKSTFYKERFFDTHVRVNLDMLKTRHREKLLMQACLDAGQPFVIDNTNPTVAERSRYIAPARAAGFRVVGWYFQSKVADALQRNARRTGKSRVPDKGVYGAAGRLELPSKVEGFDALHYVSINPDGTFSVEEWKDEIQKS